MYARSSTTNTTMMMIQVTIAPPILSERKSSFQVSSGSGSMSPPSGGSNSHDGGDGSPPLAAEGALYCTRDDLARGGFLCAHAVAEHEGGESRHVLDLDGPTPLRGRAGLCRRQQMPRRAWARTELDAFRRPRLAHDANAEARDVLVHVHSVDNLLGHEEGTLPEKRRNVAEHVRDDAAVRQGERAQLCVLVPVLELELDEEAVELGFRDREDTLVLVRVLGRHDEERWVDEIRAPAQGDVAFLHRL